MKISPPIGVLVVLIGGVAAGVALAPPREIVQQNVVLSQVTYQKLASWGKTRTDVDGRALTVAQVINDLANKLEE